MKKSTSIEALDLPKRVKNSLYFLGKIETLSQLLDKSDEELYAIRGIGKKGVEVIKEYLSKIEIEN